MANTLPRLLEENQLHLHGQIKDDRWINTKITKHYKQLKKLAIPKMHTDPSFYWQGHLFAFAILWDIFPSLHLTILPCGADTEIIIFVTSFGLSGCQTIYYSKYSYPGPNSSKKNKEDVSLSLALSKKCNFYLLLGESSKNKGCSCDKLFNFNIYNSWLRVQGENSTVYYLWSLNFQKILIFCYLQ